MSDPIFDEIRKGHEEEIAAEMKELSSRRAAQSIEDALGELSQIRLDASLAEQGVSEAVEILQAINRNSEEGLAAQKAIYSKLEVIMWCALVSAVALAVIAWR